MDVNIKVEHSNIQEICRTCATIFDESILIPAFDQIEITTKTNNEFQLADELISLNVQIGKDDGFPQQVCISCVKQLTNIHTFRLTCKEAQVKLKELFLHDMLSSCLVDDIDKTQSAKADKMYLGEDITDCDAEKENSTELNFNLSSAQGTDKAKIVKDIVQYQITKEEPVLTVDHIDSQQGVQGTCEEKEVVDNTKIDVEVLQKENNTTNVAEIDCKIKVDDSGENDAETKIIKRRSRQTDPQKILKKRNIKKQTKETSVKEVENIYVEEKLNSIKMCHDCNKYIYSSRYKDHRRVCAILQIRSNTLQTLDSEFCCFYCDEKFDSKETIEDHILKLHPIENPFQCKICNEHFVNTTKRRIHFEKVHRKPEQEDEELKNNHETLELTTDQKIYKCDICNTEYKCKRNLRNHQKLCHADGNYECSVCFKQFTNSFKFDYHLRKHDKSKQYKCQYCDKTYMQTSHLRYHEEGHTNANKPYICEECGKRFLHRCDFKMHVRIHEENVSHVCEICGKGFPSRRMFNVHKKNHNCGNQCELCGEIFNTENALKSHRSTHPKENGEKIRKQKKQNIDPEKARINARRYRENKVQLKKLYTCPVCEKSFIIPSALEKHMQVHDKNRKFKCDVCGNFYKTAYHLQSHMNRVHLKTKHYDCPICGKRFYDSCIMNFHVKCHSKAKCKYCNEEFSKAYIKAHERTHTQEKSHKCLICGEGFYHCVALQNHNKKHTLEESREMEAEILADNVDFIT